MVNKLLTLITPFERETKFVKRCSIIFLISVIVIIWETSAYLPSITDVLKSYPSLLNDKDIVRHFMKTLQFCINAVFYAMIIGVFISYLSIIPLFRQLCLFLKKFRFLPSVGLGFLFLQLGNGYVENQKTYMMIFAISVWMIDSMLSIALGTIGSDIVDYAKSLRLTKWQSFREVVIYGKASQMMAAGTSNFAIAWTLVAAIENITKSSGGIGVVLSESTKYFKYDQVYAVQILILITGILIDYFLNTTRKFIFPYD